MDWLLSKINTEFENKYSFLKLLNVTLKKASASCCITFLYPENKNLSDDEKLELKTYIKSILPLNSTLTVKFKKSYLDDNLVLKALFDFLSSAFPSVVPFVSKESAKVLKDFSQTTVSLVIDKGFLEFFNENELKTAAKKEMEKQFCTEFTLVIEKGEIAKDIELKPIQKLKPTVPRYQVEQFRNLFGGEISPNPEYIKNIKSAKTSVILAGKIENFEEKSYEVKKGKMIGQRKNYFAFVLNDTTAKIDVRYFTTIANEKKFAQLLSGDEVLILGDIEEFNKKLTLYVKAISRCKLPEKIELKQVFSNEYETPCVTPYSILSQDNLFKRQVIYNPFIERATFVVFDVETTGLDYENDELLEIGAVKIEKGTIVSKFSSLIKPANPIPPSATAINNITDAMVESSPSVDVVIRDFYRYTRGSALVGYNVSFDQKFVLQAAKKQGLVFDNEFVDVMPLAKSKLRLPRYRLGDVVKRLEITLDGAHRAYADALATAEAFLKLNSNEF